MNTPNIKLYLAISGVLIVLFLIVIFVPFGKKPTKPQSPIHTVPTPTLVIVDQSHDIQNIVEEPIDFTGVADEEIPPNIANTAAEKQNLMNQTPFDSGLFKVDFDYSEDKFIITLAEPKQENRQQFDQWLKDNYPNLSTNQFNFR